MGSGWLCGRLAPEVYWYGTLSLSEASEPGLCSVTPIDIKLTFLLARVSPAVEYSLFLKSKKQVTVPLHPLPIIHTLPFLQGPSLTNSRPSISFLCVGHVQAFSHANEASGREGS